MTPIAFIVELIIQLLLIETKCLSLEHELLSIVISAKVKGKKSMDSVNFYLSYISQQYTFSCKHVRLLI